MRTFKLNPKYRKYPGTDTIIQGKHCKIAEYEEGKILRIFTTYPIDDFSEETINNFHWGDYPTETRPQKKWCRLDEGTKIQNICWIHNLAPRVYEMIGVEIEDKKYLAQVIEDLGVGKTNIDDALKVYYEVVKLGEKFGFEMEKEDVSERDVMNGKLVDFNTFHFADDYIDKIKDVYGYYGKYGKIYYQRVPELDMNNGPRQSLERIKYMKLDETDFSDRSVIDLGCAGGFFCRYAKDSGASKVTGYDFEDCIDSDPVLAAQIIANELGYWDIDFKRMDLRIEKPPKSDIVFFLSMNYHIGIPEWLSEVTNEICIFEDNSKERNALQTLESMFKRVEFIGGALDHGNKLIYKCYN